MSAEPQRPTCPACSHETEFVRYSRIATRNVLAWCRFCRRPVIDKGASFHKPDDFARATFEKMRELRAFSSVPAKQTSILDVVEHFEQSLKEAG